MTLSIPSILYVAAALLGAAAVHAPAAALDIDTAIRDMDRPNEAIPLHPSFDWQYRPHIIQYAPKGSTLPSWWKGLRPDWCYAILTWYTAFEAGGAGGKPEGANGATNTRVQVRNLRAWILWKSGRWTRIDHTGTPRAGLWRYPFRQAPGDARARKEGDQGNSIKPAYPFFHHGYGTTYALDRPQDVRAVFVAMDFRLVVDDPDGPDDRDKARYVVNVGADYYPGRGRDWGVGYAPGVGSGRYLLAEKDWRTATLLVPNRDEDVTFDQLRRNPPPTVSSSAR